MDFVPYAAAVFAIGNESPDFRLPAEDNFASSKCVVSYPMELVALCFPVPQSNRTYLRLRSVGLCQIVSVFLNRTLMPHELNGAIALNLSFRSSG